MAEKGIGNTRERVGFANIAIPGKVDRDEFIAYCFSMEQVFILTSEGEFIGDVFISRDLLNWIVFPEDDKILGSQVVFVNNKEHNKPIVVAVISGQSDRGFIGEGQFILSRNWGGRSVKLIGDAKGSRVGLIVSGKGSKISVKSLGEDSEISISSQGLVNVLAANIITLKSLKRQVILNEGEFGGLVKVEELVEKINNIESDINSLKNVFTAWVPVPNDGGAKLKADVTDWALDLITETQKEDLENEEVKH